MLSRLCGTVSVATLLALPCTVSAQSSGDFAGYAALTTTPVGAFAPILAPRVESLSKHNSFQLRASTYAFESSDRVINVAVGGAFTRGRARTAIEVGYAASTQCGDCGIFMAGLDVQAPLVQSSASESGFTVALNPAFGIGRGTNGGGTLIAFGVSVPVSAVITTSGNRTVTPYVSPGFGFGQARFEGDSESGLRPMIAGGLQFGSKGSPSALSLALRKVFLDGAPMIYTLGFAVGR